MREHFASPDRARKLASKGKVDKAEKIYRRLMAVQQPGPEAWRLDIELADCAFRTIVNS